MPADLGTDLACVSDLSPTLATVSGRRALVEAVARRWTTVPGTLLADSEYGGGLSAALLASGVPDDLAARLERQALRDERVAGADVTVELNHLTGTLTVIGSLVDADGPFKLTLNVSDMTSSAEKPAIELFLEG